MNLKFTIQIRINKPIAEVFDAVVNPEKICKYFVDKTNAPLEQGQTVIWHWAQYGDYPVEVKKLIPNKKITFTWKSHKENTAIQAVFDFEAINETATRLKVTESGWEGNQNGLDSSYDNCSGWQHMACCLKAYLEYGIDLRK